MKKFLTYGLLGVIAVIALLALFYVVFPEKVFKLMIDGQRSGAGLVRKEIIVDDHTIAYLEGGEGQTVVLIHGFGLSKDFWPPFAKDLKGYHLVIPDVPGFGESSQVKTGKYDIESQVKRLDRFVEALKLEKFHMGGQSMGGALTATYGARYPGKVLTLMLMDPAGADSPKKSEYVMQYEKGKNLLLADNEKDYDELLALAYATPPSIPGPFKKILIADMKNHKEFNTKIWNDWKPEKYSLGPVLPLVKAPVLIMWGDTDRITDIGGAAFLAKHLKNSRTAVIKDSGHSPMMEKPAESAKAYLDFLKEKK